MEFYLGDKPCIDSEFYRFPPMAFYYPLENDRNLVDCPVDNNIDRQYDDRYIKTGMKISEY